LPPRAEEMNLSNIIKKNNVTHLLKLYFESDNLSEENKEPFFSSFSSLITSEENNNRLKEEQLLNYFKDIAEKSKKEIFFLKKELENVRNINNSLQEKLSVSEDSLSKIKFEEDKILTDAKKNAKLMVENAKKEEEKIQKNAYELGFKSGREIGEKNGLEIYMKKVQDLEKIIANIRDTGQNLIKEHEAKLVQIIMVIVKTIVGKEVEIDPSIIKDCIKKALEDILDKSMIIIHINPDDYNTVNEYLVNQFQKAGTPEIVLSKDTSIERGGALIESKMGVVDVTMQTKWEILENILDQALSEKTSLSLYH